ncbi:Cytoplasmic FMR1-interacting protein 2 [Thelohanellus kitauei]|uniref:Cytoplasmic FMR1-interacting protein 2 n=1 Tax=Thelohanellus kitauei TaxID=669202 RepID=A0A0C2MHF5_THEKT|nr:Cytoplasmic FMR1-interacting protein 2 [Thelohanellus kitauei]
MEFFEQFSNLSMFLAQPLEIINMLKESLNLDPQRYKIIYKVLALYANILENRLFIDPHRRFEIVRILLGCLTILAHQKNLVSKLESHKVSLGRLDKLFKETPAIPLVGDMISQASHLLKRTGINFEFSLFDSHFLQKNPGLLNIVETIPEIQNQYLGIISEILSLLNSSTISQSHHGLFHISPSDAAKIFSCTEKSLRTIGKWSYTLHQLFFCKMVHPLPRSAYQGDPDEVDDYSLAARYNYSPVEKSAISRIVFMLKSMYKFVKRHENLIVSAINVHIYTVFQHFIQTTINQMYQKSKKSKAAVFATVIEVLKNVCSDTVQIIESQKTKKQERNYSLPQRSSSPLSTQLYLTRTMLEMLLSMKDAKKFIEGTFATQIQAFLNETIMFTDMMDFSRCLDECTRLDTLWFKDFYIEVSAGKHIQYPIQDSIPWIMIEHLLNNTEPNSAEFLLYLTGIYDDAADYILHRLKVRHLYDEVVSESQLVFKQLCYHLGLRIYSTRRAETFSCLLNKTLKNLIYRRLAAVDPQYLSDASISFQTYQHLNNLCKQRSIQFLGGRINLNAMLSQRLLMNIKESLKNCITYFENQDIHGVILLSSLLDVYRETHANLSLDFDLPPYEVILNEVNGRLPGYLPIITHLILRYLVGDLAQNYSYSMVTERFVRSPQVFTKKPTSHHKPVNMMLIYPSKAMGHAFNDHHSLYSQFVGMEHFVEIFKLVGYSGFVAIIEEIKKCIAYSLVTTIKDYIVVLRKAMPVKFILPPATYGPNGLIEFFFTLFESIISYEQMKSGVLHNFRILGNYFLIIYMLERAVYFQESRGLFLTTPLAGVFTTESGEGASDQKVATNFEFIKPFVFERFPKNSIPESVDTLFKKANALNQEKLCCGLSVFVSLFEFVSQNMNDSFWKDINSQSDTISQDCGELHRIMSVIFYNMSLSLHDPALSAEHIFGDGVMFGGLFLVVALGQEDVAEISDICSYTISSSEIDSEIYTSMQFTSGTMKSTMKYTMKRSPRDVPGGEITDVNKKILASMKHLVSKRRTILKFFADTLLHRSKSTSVSVRCFHPPIFIPPSK